MRPFALLVHFLKRRPSLQTRNAAPPHEPRADSANPVEVPHQIRRATPYTPRLSPCSCSSPLYLSSINSRPLLPPPAHCSPNCAACGPFYFSAGDISLVSPLRRVLLEGSAILSSRDNRPQPE